MTEKKEKLKLDTNEKLTKDDLKNVNAGSNTTATRTLTLVSY
jgi:hypothetical protein